MANKLSVAFIGTGIMGAPIAGHILDAGYPVTVNNRTKSKAAALIESGRVQLNWRECTKPDRTVSEGDTVSARGFGKFELTEVGTLTKKGRIPITVQCYK